MPISSPRKKSNTDTALNPKQFEAVNLKPNVNALILAGAGSGKTLVLTHRYKKLVQDYGIPPEKIISVTFTNKAANEMRRRIETVAGIRHQLSWIGTFHGIANRVLRRHCDLVGLRKNYTIVDRSEQRSIIARLFKEKLNTNPEKENLLKTVEQIGRFKEQALRANEVETYIKELGREGYSLKRYLDIYHVYEKYCKEESLVDFSEIILSFYELLQQDLVDLNYLTKETKTILVDEFQDTNDLQFKLVRKLTESGQTIFVVGDDDQLIYSWRGANPRNMAKALTTFKKVKVIRLEQNYRSTQEILDLANLLICNNSNRMPKKLWSNQLSDNNIRLQTSSDEADESVAVRNAIAGWKKNNIPYNEIAILYRKTFLARNLENVLAKAGIPYDINNGTRFTERDEVRNAMAWLKVCIDGKDDYCAQRAINVPSRGVGDASIKRIKEYAAEHSTSFLEATRAMCDSPTIAPRGRSGLLQFIELIDGLSAHAHLHPRKLLEKIFEETKLLEYYKAKTSKDVEHSREENLLELLTAADEFVATRVSENNSFDHREKKASKGKAKVRSSKKAKELADYSVLTLEFVGNTALESLNPDQAEAVNREAVQLMTIHAAKGLEFQCVILCGLEEGILPHLVSQYGETDNSEEERRLCYVAITRARQRLFLSCVRNRNVRGKYNMAEPSRFIREMFSTNLSVLQSLNSF